MLKNIKNHLAVVGSLATLTVGNVAAAATTEIETGLTKTGNLETIIQSVMNTFMAIVGLATIVYLIYGGFMYLTSGGNAEKVTTAKNTIIYAIVGIIIIGAAYAIRGFVLDRLSITIPTGGI
ncbi:MAG: hypothetical protein WC045_02750 [Patescibacteria group bacterium]